MGFLDQIYPGLIGQAHNVVPGMKIIRLPGTWRGRSDDLESDNDEDKS